MTAEQIEKLKKACDILGGEFEKKKYAKGVYAGGGFLEHAVCHLSLNNGELRLDTDSESNFIRATFFPSSGKRVSMVIHDVKEFRKIERTPASFSIRFESEKMVDNKNPAFLEIEIGITPKRLISIKSEGIVIDSFYF